MLMSAFHEDSILTDICCRTLKLACGDSRHKRKEEGGFQSMKNTRIEIDIFQVMRQLGLGTAQYEGYASKEKPQFTSQQKNGKPVLVKTPSTRTH